MSADVVFPLREGSYVPVNLHNKMLCIKSALKDNFN